MVVCLFCVIYQVDFYLFCDSDGRGWGMLDGIIEKLDYLQWFGVSYLWLLLFYCNVGCDGGYDVIDYYCIDLCFGDQVVFQYLVDVVDVCGIGIIVELVMQYIVSVYLWFVVVWWGDLVWCCWYLWSDYVFDDGLQLMFLLIEVFVWIWDVEVGVFNCYMFYWYELDLELVYVLVCDELLWMMMFWMECGVVGFCVDVVLYMVECVCYVDLCDDGLWLLEEMCVMVDV